MRSKEKALGIALIDKVAPSQMVIKIVFDEMVTLLGEKELLTAGYELVIFMVGLQGSESHLSARYTLFKSKQNKKYF